MSDFISVGDISSRSHPSSLQYKSRIPSRFPFPCYSVACKCDEHKNYVQELLLSRLSPLPWEYQALITVPRLIRRVKIDLQCLCIRDVCESHCVPTYSTMPFLFFMTKGVVGVDYPPI